MNGSKPHSQSCIVDQQINVFPLFRKTIDRFFHFFIGADIKTEIQHHGSGLFPKVFGETVEPFFPPAGNDHIKFILGKYSSCGFSYS
jgi:hypothetical protein